MLGVEAALGSTNPPPQFSEVSEQLPCRSAEGKYFSVFLCQRCREIWREKFRWDFACYVFQALGVRRKLSPKCHVKNGAKNGKFHANFTCWGAALRRWEMFQRRPALQMGQSCTEASWASISLPSCHPSAGRRPQWCPPSALPQTKGASWEQSKSGTLGSSKRHLPKGHPWILLEFH